ncbi:MAG: RNase adapter RapZ [Oscillospiraceae bacterium]
MELVIITGMSGSGKSGAANVLEDIGYFCIDNMPPQLLPKFIEICEKSGDEVEKLAIVVDIRSGERLFTLKQNIDELKAQNIPAKILFMDASDEVLVKRYKETRRKHPLASRTSGNLHLAVNLERELLTPIREIADYLIDTSMLNGMQMNEKVRSIFLENLSDYMTITSMSFGFKYGAPNEADLVFDVRCLPNPFYIPDLKNKTGCDREVRDYVMSFDESKTLLEKLKDLLSFMVPLYIKEGKSQLIIAFGCTGGKHRSVTYAKLLGEYLQQSGQNVIISHRDIDKK